MMNSIKEDFESILTYSQDYPFELDSTEILKQWERNKERFRISFRGQTVIRSEKPVKIYLSESQKMRRFNDFMSELSDNEILTSELEDFLRKNEKGFFNNRVVEGYPSYGVQHGAKISKSLKRFLDNAETTRIAQDTISRFIQESKVEGYLYLSIDPKDFLTLSENNEHWWSCQSLDGDFRAGNLSYMVDTVTLIAYLASDKQEPLKCLSPNKEWTSKKWRMLVHIGDNCIYYNRQYPYESEELLQEIHNMVCSTMKLYGWTKPECLGFKSPNNELLGTNQLCADGRIFDTRDVIDTQDYLGYCDLIYSNSYSPVVSCREEALINYKERYLIKDQGLLQELEDFKKVFGIRIGVAPICPCCGDMVVQKESSFLCDYCIAEHDADEDFFIVCDSCSHRIYDEDEIFWVDDTPYCKDCYKQLMRMKGNKNG